MSRSHPRGHVTRKLQSKCLHLPHTAFSAAPPSGRALICNPDSDSRFTGCVRNPACVSHKLPLIIISPADCSECLTCSLIDHKHFCRLVRRVKMTSRCECGEPGCRFLQKVMSAACPDTSNTDLFAFALHRCTCASANGVEDVRRCLFLSELMIVPPPLCALTGLRCNQASRSLIQPAGSVFLLTLASV